MLLATESIATFPKKPLSGNMPAIDPTPNNVEMKRSLFFVEPFIRYMLG